jgi:uncharacterized protein YlxW (UPF0749 family)
MTNPPRPPDHDDEDPAPASPGATPDDDTAVSDPAAEPERETEGEPADVPAAEPVSEGDVEDADEDRDEADVEDADEDGDEADVEDADEDDVDVEDEQSRQPATGPADEASTAPVQPVSEATPVKEPPAGRLPRPRLAARYRAAALIGALTAALGFAIAVQVHANSQADSLSNLRADDLIGILDNQNARGDRLRQQIAELEQTLRRLQDSGDRNAAARQQAEEDAAALGVLLGTLPATGPGVRVAITDPNNKLTAEDLLDVVEELRGAGAEAIQFGSVRVSTSTAFTTKDDAVAVDGAVQPAPYQVLAIGDPKTLDTALNIPGGVAAAVRAAGGQLTVTEQNTVTIMVTRSLPAPKYATPGSH